MPDGFGRHQAIYSAAGAHHHGRPARSCGSGRGDRLVRVAAEEAVTSLVVRDTLCFVNETGCLSEPGLIEHIAQSASAFAGYAARAAGATKPPVGYIGEVKKFHCYRLPECGEELFTTIAWGPEVGGVRIVSGETRAADEVVAETQMKIFTR